MSDGGERPSLNHLEKGREDIAVARQDRREQAGLADLQPAEGGLRHVSVLCQARRGRGPGGLRVKARR